MEGFGNEEILDAVFCHWILSLAILLTGAAIKGGIKKVEVLSLAPLAVENTVTCSGARGAGGQQKHLFAVQFHSGGYLRTRRAARLCRR